MTTAPRTIRAALPPLLAALPTLAMLVALVTLTLTGCTERLLHSDASVDDAIADSTSDAGTDTRRDTSPDTSPDASPDITITHWPTPCGPPQAGYRGALCGGAACVVRDQAIVAKAGSSPALALDANGQPMVFHRVSGAGFVGRFARRAANGAWSSEALPVTTAGATLTLLDGKPLLLAYDGALHQTLLTRDPTGWRKLHSFAGKGWGGWERSMATDSAGCVHVSRVEIVQRANGMRAELATYLRRDQNGNWSRYPIADSAWFVPVALGPNGDAHLAYWGPGGPAGWSLFHVASNVASGTPTQVSPLGPTGLSERRIGLTVADGAGGGTAQLLFLRDQTAGREIVLASATAGSGTVITVITNEPLDNKCQQPPNQHGETCSYDDIDYAPLALAASRDGDVRMLIGKRRAYGTLTADCPFGSPAAPADAGGPPWRQCSWIGERKTEGALVIASLDSAGKPVLRTLGATVLGALDPIEASARVDDKGRIHVALSAADGSLRYLLLAQ